MFEFPT